MLRTGYNLGKWLSMAMLSTASFKRWRIRRGAQWSSG
jgi:hypothetical protein